MKARNIEKSESPRHGEIQLDTRPPLERYAVDYKTCAECGGRCCAKQPCQYISTNFCGGEEEIREIVAKKEAIIDIEEESLNVILRPYGLRDNTEYVRFALGALEDNPCVHYRAGKGGGCQIKSHMPNGGRLVIPNQPCLPGAETMFVMANRQPDFKALLFMIACEYRPGLTQQCLTGVERVYKRYKDSFDPRYFAKFLETLVGIYRLNSTDFYVTIFLCIKL